MALLARVHHALQAQEVFVGVVAWLPLVPPLSLSLVLRVAVQREPLPVVQRPERHRPATVPEELRRLLPRLLKLVAGVPAVAVARPWPVRVQRQFAPDVLEPLPQRKKAEVRPSLLPVIVRHPLAVRLLVPVSVRVRVLHRLRLVAVPLPLRLVPRRPRVHLAREVRRAALEVAPLVPVRPALLRRLLLVELRREQKELPRHP